MGERVRFAGRYQSAGPVASSYLSGDLYHNTREGGRVDSWDISYIFNIHNKG